MADNEHDRGFPDLNRAGTSSNSKWTWIFPVAFVFAAGSLVLMVGDNDNNQEEDVDYSENITRISSNIEPLPEYIEPELIEVAPIKPLPVQPVQSIFQQPIYVPPPPPLPVQQTPKEKIITPKERRRASSIILFTNGQAVAKKEDKNKEKDPLEFLKNFDPMKGLNAINQRQPSKSKKRVRTTRKVSKSKFNANRATFLPNRNFMLTKGAALDCVLSTALSSDVAGMTVCILTRDTYSTNGKFVLLEKGSKLVGEYQSNLKNGKVRLFVLWTRAETPNGVIVDLDSGGTDALGRAGLSGHINTHFWKRFGAGIMLSIIDDLGQVVVESASKGGDRFGSTSSSGQEMIAKAIEPTAGIKPTLTKNQGDHINILLVKDLDFSGVYGLALEKY